MYLNPEGIISGSPEAPFSSGCFRRRRTTPGVASLVRTRGNPGLGDTVLSGLERLRIHIGSRYCQPDGSEPRPASFYMLLTIYLPPPHTALTNPLSNPVNMKTKLTLLTQSSPGWPSRSPPSTHRTPRHHRHRTAAAALMEARAAAAAMVIMTKTKATNPRQVRRLRINSAR